MNKTYYKYCSAFVGYLYILDNFDNFSGIYLLLISVHNNRLVIFSAEHPKYFFLKQWENISLFK
jgi:hypothetical protein